MSALAPVSRTACLFVRLVSAVVPRDRRAEWNERWDAELWALADTGAGPRPQWRFALGAVPDALVEAAHGWTEGWTCAGLVADVRLAVRRARRDPASTIVALLVAGAGASAATSLFALFDAALLRTPPGLTHPEQLFQVGRDGPDRFDNFSYPNVTDLAQSVRGVVSLAAYGAGTAVVGSAAGPVVADVQFVTANFFDVTAVPIARAAATWPIADRDAPAAVLSDRYWRENRASVEASGFTVPVDGRAVPVAGIAPAGFGGVSIGSPPPAMWLSLGVSDQSGFRIDDRGWSWLSVIGRRPSDTSLGAAAAALTSAHANLARQYAKTIGDTITVSGAIGFRPADRREAVRIFTLLLGAAVIVLMVAAANLTGLQLARAVAAAPGTAVRVALGATRARLVRAMLVEQILLAGIGGVAAWVLAQWATTAIRDTLPYDLAVGYAPGARALLFAVAAPMVGSLAVAFWPIWRAMRPDATNVAGRGVTPARLSRLLVAVELSLSAGLLVAAALVTRSLLVAAAVDPGFDAKNVMVITVRRASQARPAPSVRAALVDALGRIPGVRAVGTSTRLPIARPQSSRTFFAAGAEYDPDARPVAYVVNAVDRGFFDALRIALPPTLAWPEHADGRDVWPVAATTAAAAQLWPQASEARPATSGPLKVVLGADVGHPRTRSLRGPASLAIFLPIALTGDMPSFVLLAHDPQHVPSADAIRNALASLSGDLIVGSIGPYAPMLVASLSDTVLAAQLGVPFAGLAMLLAAIGLYSASARRVVERRREFGVRLALGAAPASIVRGELQSALALAVPAFGAGCALVALASPALSRFIFGVNWRDPIVMSASATAVFGLSMLAAILPARRAARTDPIQAIRD